MDEPVREVGQVPHLCVEESVCARRAMEELAAASEIVANAVAVVPV
jgi:hypothetical protein